MSTLTDNELRDLIAEIVALDREFKLIRGKHSKLLELQPGASADAIASLQAVVPFVLPPSYVRLLRLHNGIRRFKWVKTPLLSTEERVAEPNLDEGVDRSDMWFFIFGDDQGDGTGFDLKTQSPDGEMEVVEFAHYAEDVRWPSLSAFLAGYRDRLKGWLSDAKADRANLEDD